MEFLSLLESWGLEEYKNYFIEEGITDESFVLLDDETINNLFRKIGPKLIFKKRYSDHIRELKEDRLSQITSPSLQESFVSGLSTPCSLQESSDASELSTASFYTFVPDDDEFIKILGNEDTLTNNENHQPERNQGPPPVKKIKFSSLFCNGLENTLEKTADGKIVLMNRKKLTNDLRQKLVNVIINELLQLRSLEISRDDFVKVTEEIIKLFPGEEKETYYVPYVSVKSGLRMPARGKLWSKYVNIKAALRIANQSVNNPTTSHELILNKTSQVTPELQIEMQFLKTAVEPYPRLLKAWEETYELRHEEYYKSNSKTENMYAAFPCLGCSFGLDLLETDFNRMYPDKIDIIYSEWPNVCAAILSEAKERCIQSPTNIYERSTEALLVLPFLFTSVTLKRNGKLSGKNKNWRPTKVEIQNSFFLRVKSVEEFDDVLSTRKETLDSFNLPCQPFAAVVGDGAKEFVVFCCDIKYRCDSAVRCLELLFKSIHALKLEYPSESKHIWHFIQEIVFKMTGTSKNSSTASVIADIKYHLEKQKDV